MSVPKSRMRFAGKQRLFVFELELNVVPPFSYIPWLIFLSGLGMSSYPLAHTGICR